MTGGEWQGAALCLAVGAGLLWHGVQIVWVAPRPSQFVADKPVLKSGSPEAFQRFWLDQYAWMGIGMAAVGLTLLGVAIWR